MKKQSNHQKYKNPQYQIVVKTMTVPVTVEVEQRQEKETNYSEIVILKHCKSTCLYKLQNDYCVKIKLRILGHHSTRMNGVEEEKSI